MMGFLIGAPLSAAASPNYVMAQDDFDFGSLLESLLTDGAELMFANVDDQGIPGVIYGQLGIPSDALAFDNEMYTGCIAMALLSTHGEFLELIFDLLAGGDFFGGDGGGGFTLAQDGGFDVNQILDMLGTEFNLLVTIFVNVAEATSLARMTSIQNHLTSQFGFAFLDLISLRIDESLFPPDMDITLPFESIDVYVRQETHEFDLALNTMFDVMNQDGFLATVDRTYFTDANAAAGGLLAIPDMGAIVDLISTFTGGTAGIIPPFYTLAQTLPFDIDGPIAIAAAGYLGEQVLSTDSTSLNVETLLGVTGTLTPLPSGNSLLIAKLPGNVNVTSISPDVPNQSFYDNESNVVFWNATALGPQSDYIISFEGDFPPLVSVERTFSPESTTPGGSTTVTVTVTNEGDEPITDLVIVDDDLAAIYSTVTVTGTTSDTVATLAGGATATITYEVTFTNEGGYTFTPAELTYGYEGNTFFKDSIRQGFIVTADVGGLLYDAIMDGMPYTGVALGVVGLVGIYAIMGLVRGREGAYQV